jgi:hypothetical protein
MCVCISIPKLLEGNSMQSRYIFDKVNQDITAAIARQVDRDSYSRPCTPNNDDLVCAIIFVVSVALLIFI